MVDSIRQTGRIGVIKPSGQLRSVERRKPSPKSRSDHGDDESQTGHEESTPEEPEDDLGTTPGDALKASSGNDDNQGTGRRIDVRI
jgi:hypothetical protein